MRMEFLSSTEGVGSNFAERALVACAVPDRVRTQLQLEFGAHVNSKFLPNVKHSAIGKLLDSTHLYL